MTIRVTIFLLLLLSSYKSQNTKGLPITIMYNFVNFNFDNSPNQVKYEKQLSEMRIKQIFNLDSCALYSFVGNSVNGYYYLLAKRNDTFQIFNAHDFLEEYNTMKNIFFSQCLDTFYLYLPNMINTYIYNLRVVPHRFPDLKVEVTPDGDTTITGAMPEREVHKTEKFIYKGK